jgi:predicted DNA-binding transcriptional regulator YafY
MRTITVRIVGRLVLVATTSARLLRLLSLLQARPRWSGPELAERLEVTTRTVRRDVDRLRGLGYPVDADPGPEGGYRLGTGGNLPPLLLDDDEAIAVAVALGITAGTAVMGIEEPALAALAKLDRLLPPPLRARVAALRSSMVRLERGAADPVDAAVLSTIAQACASSERVVAGYRDREGRESERRLEPYRLVCTGRRWYLVAHDVDRQAWRTFRVDRVLDARATGHRFRRVDPPDAAGLVEDALRFSTYSFTAIVRVGAPADAVRRRVPSSVGTVEADGDEASILTVSADDADWLVAHLVAMPFPIEVVDPPDLRVRLHEVGGRLADVHRPPLTSSSAPVV